MAISQAYFLNTITNVLGLSVKQRKVLFDDGYDTISTTIHWKYDRMREWCTTKSNLTTTRGGNSYGDQIIKFLQALAWWATYLILSGKQIFLADFYDTMMEDCIYEAKLYYEDGKKDQDIQKTNKFLHSKCVAWEELVYTYFIDMKNSRGVPFAYVICKTPDPSGIVIDR